MSAYGNLPRKMIAIIAYDSLKRSREIAISRGRSPSELRDLPPLGEFLTEKLKQLPRISLSSTPATQPWAAAK